MSREEGSSKTINADAYTCLLVRQSQEKRGEAEADNVVGLLLTIEQIDNNVLDNDLFDDMYLRPVLATY